VLPNDELNNTTQRQLPLVVETLDQMPIGDAFSPAFSLL
jgi:hypothetical protein